MRVIVTLFQLLFEYLLLLPLLVLIGLFIESSLPLSVWLISIMIAYLIGALIKRLLKTGAWWIYGMIIVIISIGASSMIGDKWSMWILLSIVYMFFLYRGMAYVSHGWDDLLSLPILWVGGFLLYLITYFLFRYVDTFSSYLPIITTGAFIFVISTLFVTNIKQLNASSLSEEGKSLVTSTMKWQNRLYLIGTVFIIALFTIGGKAQTNFILFIRWLFQLLTGASEPEEVPPQVNTPPMDMDIIAGEYQDPALFWVILEKIMIYTIYVFLACLVLFLLLSLLKKTRKWVIRLIQAAIYFLQQLGNKTEEEESDEGYVDEKENLFDWQEWKKKQQTKAKAFVSRIFKRREKWDDLTNEEKVRYLYKLVMKEKVTVKNWHKADTPREAIEKVIEQGSEKQLESLRELYEDTRYGEESIETARIEEIISLKD